MNDVVSTKHKESAGRLLEILATYTEAEDMINVGAYVKGANPKIDYAISKIEEVNAFLRQSMGDSVSFHQCSAIMEKIVSDFPKR